MVKPDLWKMVLFVIFVLITTAGIIQHAPITETPPAPPSERPSPLGNFNFTFVYLALAGLYYIPLLIFGFTGILPVWNLPPWLIVGGNIVYLYFLSCLLIYGFNRYKRRFSMWHWIAIIGLSFSLISIGLYHGRIPTNHVDDFLLYVTVSSAVSLYFLLLVCLGFFIQDKIAPRKILAS